MSPDQHIRSNTGSYTVFIGQTSDHPYFNLSGFKTKEEAREFRDYLLDQPTDQWGKIRAEIKEKDLNAKKESTNFGLTKHTSKDKKQENHWVVRMSAKKGGRSVKSFMLYGGQFKNKDEAIAERDWILDRREQCRDEDDVLDLVKDIKDRRLARNQNNGISPKKTEPLKLSDNKEERVRERAKSILTTLTDDEAIKAKFEHDKYDVYDGRDGMLSGVQRVGSSYQIRLKINGKRRFFVTTKDLKEVNKLRLIIHGTMDEFYRSKKELAEDSRIDDQVRKFAECFNDYGKEKVALALFKNDPSKGIWERHDGRYELKAEVLSRRMYLGTFSDRESAERVKRKFIETCYKRLGFDFVRKVQAQSGKEPIVPIPSTDNIAVSTFIKPNIEATPLHGCFPTSRESIMGKTKYAVWVYGMFQGFHQVREAIPVFLKEASFRNPRLYREVQENLMSTSTAKMKERNRSGINN